jgi:hypothetical protein
MTMIGRDGRPMGMWGVVPQRSDVGAIWMLCTDDLVRDRLNSMRFLREAKVHLDQVQRRYKVLFNLADARNVVHIKWLRWMGFTFIASHPNHGTEGRLFYEFARI